MKKNDALLLAILERCIIGTPDDWRLELTVEDFRRNLTAEESQSWTDSIINGHLLLLIDGSFVEYRKTSVGPCITRVTLAGYAFHEQLSKSRALRDNPFLR